MTKDLNCKYCDGKGITVRMVNSTQYHYEGDEPIFEEESCEDCGGIGKEIPHD